MISIPFSIRSGQLALITPIVMDRPSAAVRGGVCRVQYATKARNRHMITVTMASNASRGVATLMCALLSFSVSRLVLRTVIAQMSLAAPLDIARVMQTSVRRA